MSAAVKGDTASGAGRKSASGFRAPEKAETSAAAPFVGEDPSAVKVSVLQSAEDRAKAAVEAEQLLDLLDIAAKLGEPGAPEWSADLKTSDHYSERLGVLVDLLYARLVETPSPLPRPAIPRILQMVLDDEGSRLCPAGLKLLRRVAAETEHLTLQAEPRPFPSIDGCDDHDLIERCDDFARRKNEAWKLEEPYFGKMKSMPQEVQDKIKALREGSTDRFGEIVGYTASTPAGLRAKARAMEAHLIRNEDGSWQWEEAAAGSLIDNIFELLPSDTKPTPNCLLADLILNMKVGWEQNGGPLSTAEDEAADIVSQSLRGMLLQVGLLLAEAQDLFDLSPADTALSGRAIGRARRLAYNLRTALVERGAELPAQMLEHYFPAHLDPYADLTFNPELDESELLALYRLCTPVQACAAVRMLRSLKGGASPAAAEAQFRRESAPSGDRARESGK